jgi:hypothetical protein
MEKDLDEVFFREFATNHTVEGMKISCILDSDQVKPRDPELVLGQADFVLRMRKADAPKRKSAGSLLNIDGRDFLVIAWVEQDGEHIVSLSAPELA